MSVGNRVFITFAMAIAATTAAIMSSLGIATAQQNEYCGPNHPGEGAVVETTLNLEPRLAVEVRTVTDDAAFGGGQVDEVEFRWTVSELLEPGAACVWIRRAESGTPGFADFVVPIEDGSFSVRPIRLGGSSPEKACYVLIAMSDRAMGEEHQVCLTVENPRLGIPPGAGQTPGAPSVGTGLISDGGSRTWLVGFLVVTGTIVLVLVVNARMRRRAE